MSDLDIKITTLEALKPLTTRSFSKSSLTVSTWRRATKIETFILGFSYNSFQNIVRVLPSFFDWLRRLHTNLSNSVVAYKRDFFRNMASENSREVLGVRNTFSYVDTGRLEGSNPKETMEFLIQACDYK